MKLRKYAEHIGDEAVRRSFLDDCELTDKSFFRIADLLVSQRGYQIPCDGDEYGPKITVTVTGVPSNKDWLRVQAFAALALGEFDVETKEDGT